MRSTEIGPRCSGAKLVLAKVVPSVLCATGFACAKIALVCNAYRAGIEDEGGSRIVRGDEANNRAQWGTAR